ncbi:MAG: hypothetical protein HYR76_04260, partial [Ignavibacteria bacterium]|nr:hypothetical protein [Ignavibacteria bacterium]
MSEKEMFVQTWEREFQTTLKLLKQYPANKLDLKPAEKSRSAKDLAWVFAQEESVLIAGAINGKIDFGNMPQAPNSLQEIITKYEQNHRQNVEKIR